LPEPKTSAFESQKKAYDSALRKIQGMDDRGEVRIGEKKGGGQCDATKPQDLFFSEGYLERRFGKK